MLDPMLRNALSHLRSLLSGCGCPDYAVKKGDVVAEGIETSEQLEFLRLNECNEGQGHFVGTPRSANEIGSYLLSTVAVKISAA